MTVDVDSSKMNDIMDSEDTWVLDFWAEWCAPCKKMEPIYESVSESFTDVKFGKVNMEEHSDLATSHNVRALPTILMISGGEVVSRSQGFMDEGELSDWVEEQA